MRSQNNSKRMPQLAKLKKRYEDGGYTVLYMICSTGIGFLVLVPFYEMGTMDVFSSLTKIGDNLLMDIYKEVPRFYIRKRYV